MIWGVSSPWKPKDFLVQRVNPITKSFVFWNNQKKYLKLNRNHLSNLDAKEFILIQKTSRWPLHLISTFSEPLKDHLNTDTPTFVSLTCRVENGWMPPEVSYSRQICSLFRPGLRQRLCRKDNSTWLQERADQVGFLQMGAFHHLPEPTPDALAIALFYRVMWFCPSASRDGL